MTLIVEIALGVVLGLLIYHHWKHALSVALVAAFGIGVYWVYRQDSGFYLAILAIVGVLLLFWSAGNRIESWIDKSPSHERLADAVIITSRLAAITCIVFLLLLGLLDAFAMEDNDVAYPRGLARIGRIAITLERLATADWWAICAVIMGFVVFTYLLIRRIRNRT